MVKLLLAEKSLNKLINKYSYSIKEIMKIIFIENPEIDKEECYKQAIMFYKEINNINKKAIRNTKKYFKYNLPLSIFENGEDL